MTGKLLNGSLKEQRLETSNYRCEGISPGGDITHSLEGDVRHSMGGRLQAFLWVDFREETSGIPWGETSGILGGEASGIPWGRLQAFLWVDFRGRLQAFPGRRLQAFPGEDFRYFRPRCFNGEQYCLSNKSCVPESEICQSTNKKKCQPLEIFCIFRRRCIANTTETRKTCVPLAPYQTNAPRADYELVSENRIMIGTLGHHIKSLPAEEQPSVKTRRCPRLDIRWWGARV
ncbi:hypothetical protein OS493_009323 [Desmophyllum pertusum]|uniref:Uncharacterized protein n=1 Tax=Desmophyllum pertusum TaxID=174260 RepID=A0A9X0CSG0_9CNID|nr:hypothetical protein OS493_009323 [Desmophyllum pertusum]